jgi:hypothetical protein
LGSYLNDFEVKGVTLAVIGNSNYTDLEQFRSITSYHGVLLTDPDRNSFRALKFKDTVLNLVGIKSFTAGFAALRGGHKPGAMKGSPVQLGGAVIINPDNTISYYFQSGSAGDDPSISEMLRVVGDI